MEPKNPATFTISNKKTYTNRWNRGLNQAAKEDIKEEKRRKGGKEEQKKKKKINSVSDVEKKRYLKDKIKCHVSFFSFVFYGKTEQVFI
jgi:hypothetical protein